MKLRLAQTPRRRSFWVSSSGTRRRAMISLPQPCRLPVATQKTARLRTKARRPILAARPPCQKREEPMTIPRCREAQCQTALPSSWSWKMRQQIHISASTARGAPTQSLEGAAPARRTQKGDPHGRIGPPPPGHWADAEESPRRTPAKPGAPRTYWQGSRQTSGLPCQTPAASPRNPWCRTTVGGMNSLTSSCLRKILCRSQPFF